MNEYIVQATSKVFVKKIEETRSAFELMTKRKHRKTSQLLIRLFCACGKQNLFWEYLV